MHARCMLDAISCRADDVKKDCTVPAVDSFRRPYTGKQAQNDGALPTDHYRRGGRSAFLAMPFSRGGAVCKHPRRPSQAAATLARRWR